MHAVEEVKQRAMRLGRFVGGQVPPPERVAVNLRKGAVASVWTEQCQARRVPGSHEDYLGADSWLENMVCQAADHITAKHASADHQAWNRHQHGGWNW